MGKFTTILTFNEPILKSWILTYLKKLSLLTRNSFSPFFTLNIQVLPVPLKSLISLERNTIVIDNRC